MLLKGKYAEAKVFTEVIDETSVTQLIELCNQPFAKDSHIRIMPDVHAGAGCTIGTTMYIQDKVVPNLVGVDIGCGVMAVRLSVKNINFDLLDDFIRRNVPSGQDVNDQVDESIHPALRELRCYEHLNITRALKSVGTLGGGNHFIEISKSGSDELYLMIHSGSRYLGKQIAEYYQERAYKDINSGEINEVIESLKAEGRMKEIQNVVTQYRENRAPKNLAYCQGKLLEDYLHDMNIAQIYAHKNRLQIAQVIGDGCLGIDWFVAYIDTVHNYIDMENNILRKGAVAAYKGQQLVIPMNMRDGSLLCVGKGNADWNYSAPHGAGRIMSRSKARAALDMADFKAAMEGIYTTSVHTATIDEAPMAYKNAEDIIKNIGDTVDIIDILKPVYNFKASS